MSTVDHFTGSFIGQCVGDALGYPIEGYTPKSVEQFIGRSYPSKTQISVQSYFPWGQITDDSQLARELLLSLVENQGFNPEDYANRIATIFQEGKIVGYGHATKSAADRLSEGVSWKESGTPPPNAGNGSAMRVSPVGLFYHSDLDQLVTVATKQGEITHKDPRSTAGAVLISSAVAYAIEYRDLFDQEQFLNFLQDQISGISKMFTSDLKKLEGWVDLEVEEARKIIAKSGENTEPSDWKLISPYVIPSVLWSLYSFINHPNDYWKAVRTSMRCGGDVDTTAAMTGAISGAYLGIDSIPKTYREKIYDKKAWTYSSLKKISEDLYHVRY